MSDLSSILVSLHIHGVKAGVIVAFEHTRLENKKYKT